MLEIFCLLNLLVFITSEEINQWKYSEEILSNVSEGIITSLTSISSSSTPHYLYTYKNEAEEDVYSTEDNFWYWNHKNITFSPSSINLDNQIYLLFLENDNKFYYLVRNYYLLRYIEVKDDSDIVVRLKGFKLKYSQKFVLIAMIGTKKNKIL
jgi:hypothetical protein